MSIPGLNYYTNTTNRALSADWVITTTTDSTSSTPNSWRDTTTTDPNLIPTIWRDTTTYPLSPNGIFRGPLSPNDDDIHGYLYHDIYNLSNNYEEKKLTDVKNLFESNPNYLMKYITNINIEFSTQKHINLIIDIENVSLSNRDIFRTDEFHETINKEDFDKKIDKLSNILDKSSNIKSQEIYFKEFFFYLVNEDLSFLNSTKGTSLANISIDKKNTNKFTIKLKLNETDFKTPNRFPISDLFNEKTKHEKTEDKMIIEI